MNFRPLHDRVLRVSRSRPTGADANNKARVAVDANNFRVIGLFRLFMIFSIC